MTASTIGIVRAFPIEPPDDVAGVHPRRPTVQKIGRPIGVSALSRSTILR
jgi:hypothetical protein